MNQMTLDTLLVVLSNLLLAIVTGVLIYLSVKEAHRHAEKTEGYLADANQQLGDADEQLIHELASALRREQDAAHQEAPNGDVAKP